MPWQITRGRHCGTLNRGPQPNSTLAAASSPSASGDNAVAVVPALRSPGALSFRATIGISLPARNWLSREAGEFHPQVFGAS